jgi:hypothetical protein
MEPPTYANPDIYVHVRIVIGIVLGLSISRLLTGLARFIQNPSRDRVYPVHLAWVFFLLISVVHFWWFEFQLYTIRVWTFQMYMFVISYAGLFFLTCTLLFPDHMDEYSGYRGYLMSRRKWFFGLLAVIFLVDVVDSYLKGVEHLQSYGPEYPIRTVVFVGICLVAMTTTNQRFHALYAAAALIYQLSWVMRQFGVMS